MKECTKCKRCYEDDITVCPVDNEVPVFTITGTTTISGRYILDQRQGQGGMGIVFRAKHKFLKSSHAVKIILPSLVSDDENLLVRFRQEAILAASIDHPNVIRVTDFGVENDEMPYLVMEFVDGIALSSYLKEGQPLTMGQAMELFMPIAEGVAEAHSKGIVHRDLKPQNIMIQKNLPLAKAIKVLDFGLAKIKSADSYPSLVQAKTMAIVGSPPYMSPEQWSGDGVDHRTDIYALSVILYQMLTGHLPFQADSMPAMMYQHLTVEPPKASSFGVTMLPEVEAILLKGLAKDPQNRYPAMDVFLGDLDQIMGRPRRKPLTGDATAIFTSPITGSDVGDSTAGTLSDSEKKRFLSFFDSSTRPSIPDSQLAHEFLDAQTRAESAKTEAVNADMLVKELAEAEKEAEQAQEKAVQAKQRIEADVRRQVEAEMQRLASQDQEKREAEAQRLAQEVEARRAAEERANYLAQAALEAQKQAEAERKQREQEAQQRELHQGVREKAEHEAQALAQQVAEARKQYEDAKNQAAAEARQRAEAEAKQRKIEEELQNIALSEAERRKAVEAKAQKFIEEQSALFEREADAARQRLDEARTLIEMEAKKREQAEAARLQAEEEAQRLSKQIIQVQREMEEMRQHITSENARSSESIPSFITQGSTPGQISLNPLSSSSIPKQKKVFALAAGGIGGLLLLLIAGIALFALIGRSKGVEIGNNVPVSTNQVEPTPVAIVKREQVEIPGGTFLMGRDDVDNKDPSSTWGDEFPAHPETVATFLMDVYETTNAQYAEFVKAGPHKAPNYWTNGAPPEGTENLPVTNVSLLDAKAYAEWISKKESRTCRLPEEKEWEYAARNGPQDTAYPWGNSWRPDGAKLKGRDAVAVGTSDDVTSNGVKDMLGNVSEWTSTKYATYKGHPQPSQASNYYVFRGLNFQTKEELIAKPERLVTYRQGDTPDANFASLGFRLVCTK